MPIYEYLCPRCGTRLEELRTRDEGRYGRCSVCSHRAYKVPSLFSVYSLNWMQKDGVGYTSKRVCHEELTEMNKECRER